MCDRWRIFSFGSLGNPLNGNQVRVMLGEFVMSVVTLTYSVWVMLTMGLLLMLRYSRLSASERASGTVWSSFPVMFKNLRDFLRAWNMFSGIFRS